MDTTTTTEQRDLLRLCLEAALADGGRNELERAEVRRIAESFRNPDLDLLALYEEVLFHRGNWEEAARRLPTPESRTFAYELCVAVCDSDGARQPAEDAFLERLRAALGLAADVAGAARATSLALAGPDLPPPVEPAPPVAAPGLAGGTARVDDPALDKLVLNAAILNGALELLPQGLATVAIVPLQVRMVYRIGKHFGYNLDRGHFRDFAAAAGVGLTSQVVEGFARRLLGGLAGGVLGGLGRAVVGTAAGAAFTFASTWALGQLARRYYAGGRVMQADLLRQTYQDLLQQGRDVYARHATDVTERARTVDLGAIRRETGS